MFIKVVSIHVKPRSTLEIAAKERYFYERRIDRFPTKRLFQRMSGSLYGKEQLVTMVSRRDKKLRCRPNSHGIWFEKKTPSNGTYGARQSRGAPDDI